MYEADQPNHTVRLILTGVLCLLIGAVSASILWARDEVTMQTAFRAHLEQDQVHFAQDNARTIQLQRNLQQLRERYAVASGDLARLQASSAEEARQEQNDPLHKLKQLSDGATEVTGIVHFLHVLGLASTLF